MGAAGAVSIYDEESVKHAYEVLWGELGYTIEKDWNYPSWSDDSGYNRVRVDLAGRWYLVDYADDQGNHEGTGNSFWFDYERDEDEITRQWAEFDQVVPPKEQPWFVTERNRGGGFSGATPAQARVLAALDRVQPAHTEVWT